MSNSDYLSAEQAADLLDVSPSTLAKWRQSGEPALPYLRIAGRIRYRAKDVEEFLESAEVEGADEDPDDFDTDE